MDVIGCVSLGSGAAFCGKGQSLLLCFVFQTLATENQAASGAIGTAFVVRFDASTPVAARILCRSGLGSCGLLRFRSALAWFEWA
jgi:hypothetical protein